jgi:histidinol-phosphatase (PHP family)
LKADYHIHTKYCGHAKGTVREYVLAAIQLRLDEICFTDHLYRYYLTPETRKEHWDWCMQEKDLDTYVAEVEQAQREFPEISIKLGIEADYIEGHEAGLEKILGMYSFDHVLASIHCLTQLGLDHIIEYRSTDPWTVYKLFYEAMTSAAKSGLFTGMGHPDFIWRYFPWPHDNEEALSEIIDTFIRAVAEKKGMSMEANSNAVIWMRGKTELERNYFSAFFSKVAKHKVPVVIGSDSHRPLNLTAGFGEMIEILKDLGIKKKALYNKKKLRLKKL